MKQDICVNAEITWTIHLHRKTQLAMTGTRTIAFNQYDKHFPNDGGVVQSPSQHYMNKKLLENSRKEYPVRRLNADKRIYHASNHNQAKSKFNFFEVHTNHRSSLYEHAVVLYLGLLQYLQQAETEKENKDSMTSKKISET